MKEIEFEGVTGKFFPDEEFEKITQQILEQNTLIDSLRKELGV